MNTTDVVSRYIASQVKCTTINKTNDQVDLKTFTRMLNI